ncbi:MAG: hypothetical protein VR66_02935 [Peptococcaceae bacterium BRH_c23]|nr:MAG: hypothetical protein VR66_02935 [Peptococcaceae bacterium BRH_c23]KJS82260.1 MAG: hypothetical protein JL57_24850 [Desulfosporosinus sp. BICA1-9]KJS84286.1 MAG: hypothetical protein JL57_20770 [Desulfosporosinus sp. BICA1-9]KJS89000.1 MAG: hypothetical protein JL57_09745 [Desulfosporosinus sp. BICA1-9]HBW37994.1 hypothetical protein [Desulfosporosinus sp.]
MGLSIFLDQIKLIHPTNNALSTTHEGFFLIAGFKILPDSLIYLKFHKKIRLLLSICSAILTLCLLRLGPIKIGIHTLTLFGATDDNLLKDPIRTRNT